MTIDDFEKFVEVKTSGIHGLGLFSSVFIPKSCRIMVIKGEVISGAECERREEEYGNVYIFWNGDNYIDVSETSKIKYINHNCSNNCEIEELDEESLLLTACKDIMPGDELTIDYGYEEIYDECNCYRCLAG